MGSAFSLFSYFVFLLQCLKALLALVQPLFARAELLTCNRSLYDLISRMVGSHFHWNCCKGQPNVDDCKINIA